MQKLFGLFKRHLIYTYLVKVTDDWIANELKDIIGVPIKVYTDQPFCETIILDFSLCKVNVVKANNAAPYENCECWSQGIHSNCY